MYNDKNMLMIGLLVLLLLPFLLHFTNLYKMNWIDKMFGSKSIPEKPSEPNS